MNFWYYLELATLITKMQPILEELTNKNKHKNKMNKTADKLNYAVGGPAKKEIQEAELSGGSVVSVNLAIRQDRCLQIGRTQNEF